MEKIKKGYSHIVVFIVFFILSLFIGTSQGYDLKAGFCLNNLSPALRPPMARGIKRLGEVVGAGKYPILDQLGISENTWQKFEDIVRNSRERLAFARFHEVDYLGPEYVVTVARSNKTREFIISGMNEEQKGLAAELKPLFDAIENVREGMWFFLDPGDDITVKEIFQTELGAIISRDTAIEDFKAKQGEIDIGNLETRYVGKISILTYQETLDGIDKRIVAPFAEVSRNELEEIIGIPLVCKPEHLGISKGSSLGFGPAKECVKAGILIGASTDKGRFILIPAYPEQKIGRAILNSPEKAPRILYDIIGQIQEGKKDIRIPKFRLEHPHHPANRDL